MRRVSRRREHLLSKTRLLPLGLAALVAALCTAVGFVSSGTAAPRATFKAGLVSDVGRFNDKGFNQNQLTGLKFAKAHIPGLQIFTAESHSSGDYLPNFASMARRGVNLIVGAGFLLTAQEAQVAKQFPNTKFAITDNDVRGAPFNGKKSPNVEGLTYATQENSYLVGCLAGLMVAKQGGDQTIGVVGGLKIPPVDTFLAGYKAGALACNKKFKVLVGYSQDFVDQAKCKTVAQNQIDAGSQVEFNVAGPCGLGTLDAANDAGIWGIGVDVDQYALHPAHMLTSAVKRVDRGVYLAVKGAQNGQFKGGTNLQFNLKNNGVALGKVNRAVPAKFLKQIAALRAKIVAGKIKPPTTI